MIKRMGVILLALAALVGINAAAAQVAAASPSGTACRTVFYEDGRQVLRACLDYADSTSSTWVASNRKVTNIAGPPGAGHTEDMSGDDGQDIVRWEAPSPSVLYGGGTLEDGETYNLTANRYQNDGSTQWLQIYLTVPSSWEPGGVFCMRIFFNENGQTSYNRLCPFE